MSDEQAYGAPPSYGPPPPEQRRHGAGLAIGALVLGVLALLFCWTIVGGIVFGLVALALGLVASGRAKRGTGTGRGMAITGVVLGILGLLISVVLVVAGVSFLHSSSAKTLQQCVKDANGDQAKVQQCQRDFQKKLSGN